MCNSSTRSGLKVLIFVILSVLFTGEVIFAESQARWSMKLRIAIPARDVSVRGASRAKAEVVDVVVAKMAAAGVAVRLREAVGESDEAVYDVEASSSGTVDQLRRIIYRDLKPEVNLLGGVTELNVTSSGARSLQTKVVIAANPSTGYQWMVANESGYTESAASKFVMHTRGTGVPQHQVLHLRNRDNKNNPMKLIYRRPWEKAPVKMRIDLELDTVPDQLDLSDPNVPAGPAAPPPKGAAPATAFPAVEAAALPFSWDWRTSGIVIPVRDQNPCGGCWAFGTVGIMESALWKNGMPNVDLSEQFLISCNNSGWSCDGGLTAHMYHFDKLGMNQSLIGAVAEADKPYTATNGTCDQAYDHPQKLSGWQFIVPTEFDMPSVDQIKSAIYTYGPVTAGICAGDGSLNYTGGIFSTDETNECGGGTNHQIILVGWDDNNGDGYWILRNSWGPSWGIDGYMYIKYNTSRVGEGTSWVTTTPVTPTFTLKAVPPAVEIRRGGSGSTSLSTTATDGFSSSVTFSATGLPSGVTASFSPATIAAPGSGASTLTFNVAAAAAAGSYPVKITGTGGGESKETTVTLTVTTGANATLFSDGFEGTQWLYFQPSGTTATWGIVSTGTHPDVTPHGGSSMTMFNSYDADSGDQALTHHTTSFSIPSSASTVTLKFWMYHDTGYSSENDTVRPYVSTDGENYTPLATAVSRNDGTTGWAEESADLSSYKGQSNVRIGFLGTSDYGNDIYLDDVSVEVGAAGDFTLAASSAALTVAKGGRVTATVTTTALGGFNDAIDLSITGLPSGVVAAFTPATIAAPGSGSATVAVRVSTTVAPGSYPVTITGRGAGVTKTASITLAITDSPGSFTMAVSPVTVTVAQGGGVSATLTTTLSGGFNGAVTLSATGLPTGMTVTFSTPTIPAPGGGAVTVTFNASANLAAGTYPVTLVGTAGGVTRQSTVTVTVPGSQLPFFSIHGLGTYQSFTSMCSALTQSGTVVAYARNSTLRENMTLDRNIILVFKGGYNSTFTSVTGTSTIDGTLVVRRGKLVVDHFVVR